MSATITDLFCGAGGSSLGATFAGAELRLGLNHWERAIETHATNFPDADHDCEDVSSLTTAQIRRYPDSDILLASPECTNHSLAKGARRRKPQAASLFEDGPAGDSEQDRSRATMWDVVRFAEQKLLKGKPYKAIIVENVVDAFKWGADDDGGLFEAWRTAMAALGYEHEIVWLNSMFTPPTPQSRDRMYVVFWRRGIRRPDLKVRPPSWCPKCEKIVAGQQAWKKPGPRVWGRYGAQYLFSCPDCSSVVLPGVFPAITALDLSLPAQKIGDRSRPLAPNTRERIRRGIAKVLSEPFAIRLTHGGVPKPLTLPLVTLTARHDMAIVLPIAGNTSERTPGNRARDANERALDTVHGTLDRALVMANTENGVPRDAESEAAQTLRTEGGLALVYANRTNCVPKPVEEAPTHCLCTGGHLAVVMRNNTARGDAAQMSTPAHEPLRTLTAYGGRQSLVLPYGPHSNPRSIAEPMQAVMTRDRFALVVPPMGGVDPRLAELEPAPTQTTTTRAALVDVSDQDIDECRFRMFDLAEIANAMVMAEHVSGDEYVVLGNKREVMAQLGNAVVPPSMQFLVGQVLKALDERSAA